MGQGCDGLGESPINLGSEVLHSDCFQPCLWPGAILLIYCHLHFSICKMGAPCTPSPPPGLWGGRKGEAPSVQPTASAVGGAAGQLHIVSDFNFIQPLIFADPLATLFIFVRLRPGIDLAVIQSLDLRNWHRFNECSQNSVPRRTPKFWWHLGRGFLTPGVRGGLALSAASGRALLGSGKSWVGLHQLLTLLFIKVLNPCERDSPACVAGAYS